MSCFLQKKRAACEKFSVVCHIGVVEGVYIGEGSFATSHERKSIMQDEQILDLYFARDERAIAETERRYGAECKRLSMSILHSEADADECVNDTWLKAWNAIPPKRPTPFRAFLLRLTRNISINRFRYHHSECRDQNLTVALDELEACIPMPEENSPELAEMLSEFLRTLSERDRLLFMGRYFHALTVEELARRVGMKANTVSVHLYRAREALRVYLAERGYSV